MFNEYNNWSEINQSNCTIDGRKLVWFLHTVIDVGNISEDLWVIFGELSDIVESDILTMQRFYRCLQIFVLWGLAGMWMVVAVTSLIVMSSCIKISKQHNFPLGAMKG